MVGSNGETTFLAFWNYLVRNSADAQIVMLGILYYVPEFLTASDRLIFNTPRPFPFLVLVYSDISTVDIELVENCRLRCVDLLFAVLGRTELSLKLWGISDARNKIEFAQVLWGV
jgi:hypothetical protein